MYTITVKVRVIASESGLAHVDRIYERKVDLLATALQVSSNVYKLLVKVLNFIEI